MIPHHPCREKRKKGLCILAAAKKKPFLADPKFLKYKGFAVGDEADNGIQLWYLAFDKDAEAPKFKECARHPRIDEKGYVLYYTSQCPLEAGRRRRTRLRRSRLTRCSATASILRMSR